jgi:outer membrane protein
MTPTALAEAVRLGAEARREQAGLWRPGVELSANAGAHEQQLDHEGAYFAAQASVSRPAVAFATSHVGGDAEGAGPWVCADLSGAPASSRRRRSV